MTNLTGVFPNLSRAYEIALLGGYSITITYSSDLSDYPQANEDYQIIKKFFEGVHFVSDGDIWIEIVNPKDYNRGKYSETLDAIKMRVHKAEKNPEPKQEYCTAGRDLLKNAVNKMNLSLKDVEIIQKISSSCAKLDGETEIQAHHVAEAIQYRIKENWHHLVINAESDSIQFGSKITIKRGEIDYKDAEKAINYLKGML